MKGICTQISLLLTISISTVLSLTPEDRIREHGYPVEKHVVQTEDGYILTMFRIPYPRGPQQDSPRPVAFLQHGILSSSDCWILNGPGLALAYMLVDDGYDVWLGNNRGNTYSKRHVEYSSYLKRFWKFDWHEIALFDMPAMIDYVLYKTGQQALHYVGHSQGTTVLFVMTSMIPSYNQKIKSAQLLAPVAYMNNIRGPFVQILTPFLGLPNGMVEVYGSMELFPNCFLLRTLEEQICRGDSYTKHICSNVIFMMFGFSEKNLNMTLLADIIQTHPAGASVNQFMHFLQEHISGEFRQFDYGFLRNIGVYGQLKPPKYSLNKVTAPIFLYYADNDYVSHPTDVQRLINNLPNVQYSYKVPDVNWNHLDHLWGNNVKEIVFERLLENVNRMESLAIQH